MEAETSSKFYLAVYHRQAGNYRDCTDICRLAYVPAFLTFAAYIRQTFIFIFMAKA